MMDGSRNIYVTLDGPAGRELARSHYGDQRKADEADSVVFIIDDDPSIRQALQRLLKSVSLRAEVFESVGEFLRRPMADVASCLILDIRLPGLSGLEFQQQLADDGVELPVIFMTGFGDIPMTVQAMKAGAVDFLTKPFRDQDLLDAVMAAIERDRKRRDDLERVRSLQRRLQTVTEREQQVMPLVAAGLLNKQIAAELGISEVTVKVHRGSLMRKMNARSVPDLVRMADLLEENSGMRHASASSFGPRSAK